MDIAEGFRRNLGRISSEVSMASVCHLIPGADRRTVVLRVELASDGNPDLEQATMPCRLSCDALGLYQISPDRIADTLAPDDIHE